MDSMEHNLENIAASICFPKGLLCVDCKTKEPYRLRNSQFKCRKCKKRFRLFTGTFLENTKITLTKWIEIIYGFIKNTPIKTLERDTKLTTKTIYNTLNLIRLAVVSNLPEKEKESIIKNLPAVFGVNYYQNKVSCIPLPGIKKISRKELAKLKKEKKFKELITKKQIYFLDYRENRKWNEPTVSPFTHYFQNEHQDLPSKLYSKKFYLYLKGAEYLFNEIYEGKTESQQVEEIFKKLLVHAST